MLHTSQSTPGHWAWHTVTTVTSGGDQGHHQVLNMDGDKNGGHNGQGPGPAKPDPQEANNSDKIGRLEIQNRDGPNDFHSAYDFKCALKSMLKACSDYASLACPKLLVILDLKDEDWAPDNLKQK